MRVGLDLRAATGDALVDQARQADRFGVWAVMVSSPLDAAVVATGTDHIHLALFVDPTTEHPLTIAEEIAVLDQLSTRRMLAVVDAADQQSRNMADHIRRLLGGHIVDGVTLAPPPAQTAVTIWHSGDVPIVELTGDLGPDRSTIDDLRDHGHTHAFAQWPGSIKSFARHLVTRALTADFPQIVADHADVIAPITPADANPRQG